MNRSSTSPYRASGAASRTPGNAPESVELLIRSLERENNSLVEEVNILKQKSRKVNDLQEKTELIVKHNDQLLRENERLAKLINQKKNEVQVWKNKYETLAVNRSATSDLENRKLINEIEKLKEEATDIQHMKNMQLSQLKNQNHLQIQNLKRHHLSNNEKYELEIRKLKEYCEKKEYQISDLNMKLVRLSKETDFEIGKLREEKERLRSDLLYEQGEHKKEIDSLKGKFEYNFHSQIENLKKQHLNQVQALDYENSKLKEVIASKNGEIEQILAKNLKVKNNYEDSIDLLKKENEDLKDKIFETERIADMELAHLRDKLEGNKESELTLLKNAHANQTDLLNREINKLQEIIDQRSAELEILAKEKQQVRQALEAEIVRAKAQLEAAIVDNKQQLARHQKEIATCDLDLRQANEEMKTMETYLQSQVSSLSKDNTRVQELLDRKTDTLEQEQQAHYQTKSSLESQLAESKEKLACAKQDFERDSKRNEGEAENTRKINELRTQQLETAIKGLQEEGVQKDALIAELREIIASKEAEIVKSNEKIAHLEQTQKDLRREARESLARWEAKEAEYNALVKSQTDSSERARKRELEELRGIHDNKISSLKHQIRELERQVDDKNKLLNALKAQYQDLVNKFEEVFGQRAAQKSLDIKVPGWIPDTIATKSLFDVFLKNKVIEYCS